MISIIVAASSNLVIGKNNDLPWHLPSDLKRFKELTSGNNIVMGRKCWESLPEKFRPLPNRTNIVVSKTCTGLELKGALVVSDLDIVLKSLSTVSKESFIIGGAQIYKEGFKYANKLYMTEVLGEIDGDTYLEGFNLEEWNLTYMSQVLEENGLKFIFKEYIKKVSENL